MKLRAAAARLWASLIAVAAGWGAATAATLPMEFVKIDINATGGLRTLFWSLGAGALVWSFWTLLIAGIAWLCGGLPAIAMVRERWLLGHRRRAVGLSAALGWSIPFLYFKAWDVFKREGNAPGRKFYLYAVLMTVLSGVAAAVYLRLILQMQPSRVSLSGAGRTPLSATSSSGSSGTPAPASGVDLKR